MPIALTNGITTHYQQQGSGPPVVLIHGHSADRRLWEPQALALADAGHRAIRYDLRGHGCTDAPASGYTYANYVADLRDLLDHLAVERAHLVGLSMGGAIALSFALDHPKRVASLALMDSSLPGFTYSPEFEADVERLRDAIRTEGPTPALEKHWLAHPIFDGIRRLPDRYDLLRQMVLTYPAADYLDETEYLLPERQAIDRLDEIAVPTLVIVGELDLPDFLIITDLLAENIANARKLVIADAGHVVNLEQPDAVNEALLSFLREASEASS